MAKVDSEAVNPDTQTQEATSPGKGAGRTRTRKAKTAPKGQKTTMTAEHKAALKRGREEGRIVSDYLEALEQHKPKRGRKVTVDTINERIAKINSEIDNATGKERLRLIQDRINLQDALRRAEDSTVVADLQEAFVRVAKGYAERNGFTYTAFREVGVPAPVLKEAGLARKSA